MQYDEPPGANKVVMGWGAAVPLTVLEKMPEPVALSKACTELLATSRYCPVPLTSVGPTPPTGSACAPETRPVALMLLASTPSNWPNHDPAAGDVVSKPTHAVPPGQELLLLFPAHQTWTGGAGALQVPYAGEPLQLFCPKETKLLNTRTETVSKKVLMAMFFLLILRGKRLLRMMARWSHSPSGILL